MEIHSDHNLLDSLRAVLHSFENDKAHDPHSVAELKRVLRARIAELEAADASHHISRMGNNAE